MRILAAAKAEAHRRLADLLRVPGAPAPLEMIPAESIRNALDLVQSGGIDVVACGINFDGSRMFELLSQITHAYPQLPFIATQVLPGVIGPDMLRSLHILLPTLGARGFVSLVELERDVGLDRASQAFAERFFALLREA